jgi:hypothetical protein
MNKIFNIQDSEVQAETEDLTAKFKGKEVANISANFYTSAYFA